MKRLFLAILLLGLTTLMVPSLRERMQPRIDESREWLGHRLEGPLSPVLTPYRTLKTQSRMGEAVRILIRDRNRGMLPPPPSEFPTYLEYHEIDGLDGWGAPLILSQEADSVAILSAGPDLEYRTEDDIVTKVRYADPNRHRFR
jgi:hypothetical protein